MRPRRIAAGKAVHQTLFLDTTTLRALKECAKRRGDSLSATVRWLVGQPAVQKVMKKARGK